MPKVYIFTDGSCLGNPGPGGWAAILTLPDRSYQREFYGAFRLTTNNRMELLAVIEGLGALKEPCEVELYTDSQYVRNALEKGWLQNWRLNGWRTATKKPVLNRDLWERLIGFLQVHKVRCNWIKGHAGHAENDRCDTLARAQAAREDLPADEGFEQSGELF